MHLPKRIPLSAAGEPLPTPQTPMGMTYVTGRGGSRAPFFDFCAERSARQLRRSGDRRVREIGRPARRRIRRRVSCGCAGGWRSGSTLRRMRVMRTSMARRHGMDQHRLFRKNPECQR